MAWAFCDAADGDDGCSADDVLVDGVAPGRWNAYYVVAADDADVAGVIVSVAVRDVAAKVHETVCCYVCSVHAVQAELRAVFSMLHSRLAVAATEKAAVFDVNEGIASRDSVRLWWSGWCFRR